MLIPKPLHKILVLFAVSLCFSFTNQCCAQGNDSLQVKELLIWVNKKFIGSFNGNRNLLLIETPISPRVNDGCTPLKGIETKDSTTADSLYIAGINLKVTYKWKNNLINFANIIADSTADSLMSGEGNTVITTSESIFYCQPYFTPARSVSKDIDSTQKYHLPLLWLSYPIFSANKKYALIRFLFHCGSLCGRGYTYILKKSGNGQWSMVWGCGYVS